MKLRKIHTVVFGKDGGLELVRDNNPRDETMLFKIQHRNPLDLHSIETVFQLLVLIIIRRILFIIVIRFILRNPWIRVFLPCLILLVLPLFG